MATVFLTTWAAGLLGVLAMCRMDHVAWKFVRLIGLLALLMLVPVVVLYVTDQAWQRGPWANGAAVASVCSAGCGFLVMGMSPLAKRYGRSVRGLAAVGGIAGLAAVWAWGVDQELWPSQSRWRTAAALAAQAQAALLVGAVTLATALGHAYLTQTAMTIQPLRRLSRLFALAMGIRVMWALAVAGVLIARGASDWPQGHWLISAKPRASSAARAEAPRPAPSTAPHPSA
jgi:hypothetical protein